MKLLLVLSFLFLTACNLSTPEQRADLAVKKVSYDLSLNDDQKAKLNDVKQAYLDLRKENEGTRNKHLDELKQGILSEKLDIAKARSVMAERQKLFTNGFERMFPKIAVFHSSLTQDQKKKAVEMVEKFSKVF